MTDFFQMNRRIWRKINYEYRKTFQNIADYDVFMNMTGAVMFIPQVRFLRELGGLPEAGNSFYPLILSLWIFFFGVLYLRLAFAKTRERFFVLVGALGKSSFAILLAILALTGVLPTRAALAGMPDLIIAVIFFAWLYKTRIDS